jgi:hypothetical protein
VTNGQALNAYAYVYNDPINLVDPGGNIPSLGDIGNAIGDAVVAAAKRAPDSWKSDINSVAEWGINFYDAPDAESCSCDDQAGGFLWGPPVGVAAQGAWGTISQPAARYGSYVIEARFDRQVARWWRNLPGIRSRLVNKIIPRHWGYKTVKGPWQIWPGTARSGWLDDIVPSSLDRTSGIHSLSKDLRYRVSDEVKWRNGLRGAAGATLISGLIDGAVQALSDWKLCLSKAERAYRAAIATGLGLFGGALGAITFAALTGSASLAATPVLAGLAIGLGISALADYFEVKEKLFAYYPD